MSEKTIYKKISIGLGIIVTILLAVFIGQWSASFLPKAQGSSPPGYATMWATSSSITLGTSAVNLFATSTSGCLSRVVTTRSNQIIIIKFGDHANFTLGEQTGHLQNASSTVTYDSGTYGCGLWTAIALGSTTASGITVTEFDGFK